ncbi:hypothetical protein BMS3Bbin06_00267 [bacterium BMS3Bbin06]|nr:hypothetical protein BMS3Abin08_01721 [bacterium BMS3Abin08]GBE33753.1 hypothetical protein BMS3Bbin06_00267 [bacterium BMS3Bbin06]
MEIIKCIEKSSIIKKYDILVFEIFEGGFYIKITASLIDDTELYIREYSDVDERNYSYHWQDYNRRLLMLWDNAGHHRHIETYPHHLHCSSDILPSYHISCEEILKDIEDQISSEKNR